MEALYIILGAVLALGGGVITHHIQMHYAQLKEEAGILFEIEKSLLELSAIENELERISPDTKDPNDLAIKNNLEYNRLSHLEKLHLYAIRIISDKNRPIAVKVTKYALDKHLRTKKNGDTLLKDIQIALNKKLLNTYLDEMNNDATKF